MTPTPRTRLPKRLSVSLPTAGLLLLLLLYSLYAAAFIQRTSFSITVDGSTRRYYALADDPMIAMRYARNLANGDGLVWNPGGERVEGFTNPAWLGVMALVHLAEHDITRTSLWVQVIAAALLALNLVLVYGLTRDLSGSGWAALLAAVCTAAYWPLNVWSLQGGEVALLTPLTTGAVWWAVRAARVPLGLYVLLGLGTLVRLDFAVTALAILVMLIFADRLYWRRRALVGGLALGGIIALQLLARRWYFDAWMPNTYTLKMTGYPVLRRLEHGLFVLAEQLFRDGAVVVIAGLVLLWRPWRRIGFVIMPVLAASAYTVYIGGDTWESYNLTNRFWAQTAPLLLVLLVLVLHDLDAWLLTAARYKRGIVVAALILVAVGMCLDLNYITSLGAKGTLRQITLVDRPVFIQQNEPQIRKALLLDRVTAPGARVAVVVAGTTPYFSERTFVDMLGKTDPVIARRPAYNLPALGFFPGHIKWDYTYLVTVQQPDVVLEQWPQPESARPLLLAAGYERIALDGAFGPVYARSGSPYVRWDRVTILAGEDG